MSAELLEPGLVVDGYTVGDLIHKGGMAYLWRATHPEIPFPLLMKVPKLAEGEDPATIVSFEMEQMILPRVKGLHVPKTFGVGDFAKRPYVVMEEVSGPTLLPKLKSLPLPPAEVANIGAMLATALDSLHRQNVIHLDLKPSNVLFRPSGEAVLIDYGLSHHTQLPDLMAEQFRLPYGTAPYMAPIDGQIFLRWAFCSISLPPPYDRLGIHKVSKASKSVCGAILFRHVVGEPIFPYGYKRLSCVA
jgi:eukaryotic-like serine/threonine-protein kinase